MNNRAAIRSELCSLAATTYLILHRLVKLGVHSGSLTLYNDCSKAIKYINHPGRKFNRFLLDDYDLLSEIHTTINRIQQRVSFKLLWVKGHFTGKNREPQHDLNAEAHTLAKSALSIVDQSSVDIPPPSSLAYLQLGHILTSAWHQTIRKAAHSDQLQHTICKRSGWSDDQFYMVDWEALHSCLKGFSRVKLLSYCKLMHDILSTNEQASKFYGKPSHCPHCGISPESFLHVVTCPNKEITAYRAQQQELLWKSLRSLRTPQIILQYIQRGVIHADQHLSEVSPGANRGDGSAASECPISALSVTAFQEQYTTLGWDHFLRGRLSKKWKEAFIKEFLSRNAWANGTHWSSGVITAVLTYSLSLWKFRCALLYGRTKDETARKTIEDLRWKVTRAYKEFTNDPLLVRQDYKHLFDVPLNRRLLQDCDCLRCFLTTLDLAKEERAQYIKCSQTKPRDSSSLALSQA